MKRFHFRLDRVLRMKQQREHLAELKQLQARVLWEAAERELTGLQDQLAQMGTTIEQRIGRPVEAIVWLAQYQHMTQLRRAVDVAESKVARARAVLDETNRIRRAAAAEVEALLFLRRKQWQQHRAEAARAEQDRSDEMGLNRWRRQPADEQALDKTALARTETESVIKD